MWFFSHYIAMLDVVTYIVQPNEWKGSKMERTCEFCGAPQPVVYCQADAALLCLSCDSKVHSANALFSRHSRTLLCDSCKQNPSFIRCLDHSMLLCQHCDSRLHNTSTAHKKLMIGSFTGCPSAKHFATIWGFDVNHLDHYSAVESSVSAISTIQTSQHKVSGDLTIYRYLWHNGIQSVSL